ncbi:unnamed protein product [Caenorhabditis nigoni]
MRRIVVLVISISLLGSSSKIPPWELAGNCGECQYCLVLHGYDDPYFCVYEATDIPCYIRLHSFPTLYDADCLDNRTEVIDGIPDVSGRSTVVSSIEAGLNASMALDDSVDKSSIQEQLSTIFHLLAFILILNLILFFIVIVLILLVIKSKSMEST